MSCDDCTNRNCPASGAHDATAHSVASAAAVMRAARAALQQESVDACVVEQVESTCAGFEDRAGPRRMLIELLLQRGELNRAEQELARALLAWPNDRRLVLLRGRWLMLATEFGAAVEELSGWLERQPWDGSAHRLAGEAAVLAGDRELAAGHFALAAAHERVRPRRRWLLARAHLEAGQLDAARQWITDVGRPCPDLEGMLAERCGQLLDASDLLTRAATANRGDWFGRQLVYWRLLAVRSRLGSSDGVLAISNRLTTRQPLAWAAAAEALLTIGRTADAAVHAARLQRHVRRHALAGHILVVAAALNGRNDAARRTLARLNRFNVDRHSDVMARLWRNGLLSRVVRDQCDGRRCGSDPSPRLLEPLLQRAVSTLEGELRSPETADDPGRRLRLSQHYSAVLTAMGRPLEAMHALDAGQTPPRLRSAA